jgi:hypothetical protein
METNETKVPAELPVIAAPTSMTEAAELGREIGANWRKAVDGVLKTGELCARALKLYGSSALPVVLGAAQLSRPTFMKLVVIGRDPRLRPIEVLLPPNYSIIHEISQLDDGVFGEAVKAGVIHPHVRRAEIQALRKPGTSTDKGCTENTELPAAVKEVLAGGRYELVLPTDIRPMDCVRIRVALDALQKKFGVEITIKKSEATPDAVVTPAIASGSVGSPVNKLTPVQQPVAPLKLTRAGAPPSAKQSP